jgi:pimeloyl-ACP methyl ester carboxylesterase
MLSGIARRILWCGLLFLGMRAVRADEEPPQNLNLQLPTLGGMQFWADELLFLDWRIQRNVLTDHCRLLDGSDQRHAWGSFEQCRAALEAIKRERHLPPMRGRAVILLHGLGGSRVFMKSMENYLREQGKMQVFSVGYASTQGSVEDHARTLGRVIDRLDGIEEIDFVAHSLGNIIVRHYLQDVKSKGKVESRKSRTGPKFRRMVMIGPPNHGSTLAMMISEAKLLQGVGGKSAAELGRNWNHLQGKLATPDFEFAVIAGGKADGRGYNVLMPGDNDGLVAVDDARLVGARDWTVTPVMHAFLPHDPRVQKMTLRFLKHGYLQTEDKRQPINEVKE